MIDQIAVRRYAEAFLGFAKETIGQERAFGELKNLKNIIDESPEFMRFLKSMEITYREKAEFIDEVFGKEFSEELRQFLKLLLRKERINEIIDIAEYIRVTYAHGEIFDVSLKSAFPLDEEALKNIKEALEKRFQKKFNLHIGIDTSLLGGIQVKMDNTIIDGTVKRRLIELKEKMMTARVV